MQFDDRLVGDVTIVKVTGEISLNKGGDLALRDKIVGLLEQGRRKLVLEVGGVSYVDSAGLGQLVHAKTAAARTGGTLKLANLAKRLRELLVVSKLLSIFEIHENEADAVASFARDEG